MPVFGPTFNGVVGTPLAPLFAEVAIKAHDAQSDAINRPFVNIFHFYRLTNLTNTDEGALVAAFNTVMTSGLNGALSDQYLGDSCDVRFMDDPTRAAAVLGATANGGVAGDRYANLGAVVTRKKCAGARGRSYKGSSHWGPIPESHTTKDELNVTGLAAWAVLINDMNTSMVGGLSVTGGDVWLPIVLSATMSNLTSNPISASGAIITEFTLNTIIGTMRRRKERIPA